LPVVLKQGEGQFKGLLGLIFATCDLTLRYRCRLGVAGMTPEKINEIEQTSKLQLTRLSFFDTSKVYPEHFQELFIRQTRQGFVVEELGGREFIEQMYPRLGGFGIVLDL
jgi:hypothetical protein